MKCSVINGNNRLSLGAEKKEWVPLILPDTTIAVLVYLCDDCYLECCKQNIESQKIKEENIFDDCVIGVSLCKGCYCMTKTISKCGKCGESKPVEEV